MKLVIIYGPPAVGKLTVGTELARITGFKLFHNHLTQDLARELYPEFDEVRFKLVDKIRIDVIEYAAQNDTDLIFTFVNSGSESDDEYIAKIVDVVNCNDGQVMFAELSAATEEMLKRVGNESRKQFHKLTDSEFLKTKLDDGAYSARVKHNNIFELDVTDVDPTKAAQSIAKHFALTKQ